MASLEASAGSARSNATGGAKGIACGQNCAARSAEGGVDLFAAPRGEKHVTQVPRRFVALAFGGELVGGEGFEDGSEGSLLRLRLLLQLRLLGLLFGGGWIDAVLNLREPIGRLFASLLQRQRTEFP